MRNCSDIDGHLPEPSQCRAPLQRCNSSRSIGKHGHTIDEVQHLPDVGTISMRPDEAAGGFISLTVVNYPRLRHGGNLGHRMSRGTAHLANDVRQVDTPTNPRQRLQCLHLPDIGTIAIGPKGSRTPPYRQRDINLINTQGGHTMTQVCV